MTKSKAVTLIEGKKVLARFHSISFAGKVTKADPSHITKSARGVRRTAGSYTWSYLNRGLTGTRGMTIQQIDKATGDVVAEYRDLNSISSLTEYNTTRLMNVMDVDNRVAYGCYWRTVS